MLYIYFNGKAVSELSDEELIQIRDRVRGTSSILTQYLDDIIARRTTVTTTTTTTIEPSPADFTVIDRLKQQQ